MTETTAKRGRSRKAVPAVRPSAELVPLERLIEEGQEFLTRIVNKEEGSRSDYLRLADTLIDMRRHFKSPGREFPDWRGRSQEYRMAAAKVYEAAEVPPDSESAIQARIRYVIGDRLREVAPADQLEALNYKRGTNAERAAERRAAKRGKVLDTEGPTLTAPGQVPITTRAEAFRAVRGVVEQVVWNLPIPGEDDEEAYVELMVELVETAKLFEQLWALHERRRSVRRNTIELGSAYAATVAQRPSSVEGLAAIRAASSSEARYLSAPPPAALDSGTIPA